MISAEIKGCNLVFNTSEKLFSPSGIDRGTLAMLSVAEFREGDRVLDLGCGYGVVGILAAKLVGPQNVVMTDVDEEAVRLSCENAALNHVEGVRVYRSDGFGDMTESGFSLILSNPPYHTDFSVPREFVEKGFNRLVIGGRMFMVTKRKEWYRNKLASIFGGVRLWETDGYYVFMAEKRSSSYAKTEKEKR